MLAPTKRPVGQGSPGRSRRGPATVTGGRSVAGCHWRADGSLGRRGAEPEARRPVTGRSQRPSRKGRHMTDRYRQALKALPAVLLLGGALAAPPALAAPAAVNLRVEGATKTTF